ncbi:hypothetical protein L228DRAFT_59966 [Xylona heveae TC161]|uniref:Uncharacterized protein n=1 Tax=Xylona heveae (strain CBS 132557 / TC161) TaxID=1328760 RepID=A0A165IJX1_XYLHT|nr:hypothetical protein L228DRAFT_59966 [Xylona heveae TC161]KZF24998.1 hypothetical protein L228DRAFT_59966 [Xylona heveae TC161]
MVLISREQSGPAGVRALLLSPSFALSLFWRPGRSGVLAFWHPGVRASGRHRSSPRPRTPGPQGTSRRLPCLPGLPTYLFTFNTCTCYLLFALLRRLCISSNCPGVPVSGVFTEYVSYHPQN